MVGVCTGVYAPRGGSIACLNRKKSTTQKPLFGLHKKGPREEATTQVKAAATLPQQQLWHKTDICNQPKPLTGSLPTSSATSHAQLQGGPPRCGQVFDPNHRLRKKMPRLCTTTPGWKPLLHPNNTIPPLTQLFTTEVKKFHRSHSNTALNNSWPLEQFCSCSPGWSSPLVCDVLHRLHGSSPLLAAKTFATLASTTQKVLAPNIATMLYNGECVLPPYRTLAQTPVVNKGPCLH